MLVRVLSFCFASYMFACGRGICVYNMLRLCIRRNGRRDPYLALAATGFIWVRYSMVITPVNYSLGAVSPFY